MTDLDSTLRYCYESLNGSYGRNISSDSSYIIHNSFHCMVIPITRDTIEVPSFAMYALDREEKDSQYDAVVTGLSFKGRCSEYRTLSPAVCNVLRTGYSEKFLIKFPLIGKERRTYYGTQGAVFDKDFNPIMMTMWRFERIQEECSGKTLYGAVKPLLWISPRVVMDKKDSMQRFIINKVIPAALSLGKVFHPYSSRFIYNESSYSDSKPVEVIINDCPFLFRGAASPSASTTNRELLDIAVRNINELVE